MFNTVLPSITGRMLDLFAELKNYADLTVDSYSDNDATARITFNGRGIEIYGLKII